MGPDAALYVADSALGVLWHIDVTTGRFEKAYEGEAPRARAGHISKHL